MPYIIEAILFLSPFALYALWSRLNPGRAVGSHIIALALLGLAIAIGGAAWYGLSRGSSPTTAYSPPRLPPDAGASPRPVPPAGTP